MNNKWQELFDRYGNHDDLCDKAQPNCSCGMREEYRACMMENYNNPPRRFHNEYDNFTGTEIGRYVTREGKAGIVLQQDGTKVVHVYGEHRLVQVGAPFPAFPHTSRSGV